MSAIPMIVAALILLPAVGLVVWAWLSMARVEQDLSRLSGFEGMTFDIGLQAAENNESAKWPIPG